MNRKTSLQKPLARRLGPMLAVLTALFVGNAAAQKPSPAEVSVYLAPEVISAGLTDKAALEKLAAAPLFVALGTPAPQKLATDLATDAATPDLKAARQMGPRHLVVVATPEDALCARIGSFRYGIDTEKKTLTAYGVGFFGGEVGTLETRVNPWLYSSAYDDHEQTTLLVQISGTSPEAVLRAFEAFCSGMNNGVVPTDKTTRRVETLLDLEPSVTPPPAAFCRTTASGLRFAGWTQCPEGEYRALLELCEDPTKPFADLAAAKPYKPEYVWRIKYQDERSLDGASGVTWFRSSAALAPLQACTVAQFPSVTAAQAAFNGLSSARGAQKTNKPAANSLSFVMDADENVPSPGRVVYWQQSRYLIASSLNDTDNTTFYSNFTHE